MTMDNGNKKKGKRDRIGVALYLIYVVLLCLSIVLIGGLFYTQVFWQPNDKIAAALRPRSSSHMLEPLRGSIMDCNGKLLAMSYPVYSLHLDCTVGEDGEWYPKASKLADGLSKYFPEKSSEQYSKLLKSARRNGSKYLTIGKKVDFKTLSKLKTLPLFKEGRNKGGLIVEQENIRQYPYGKLARRTIGFVRDNKPGITNNMVGIEGHYNSLLHGKDGKEWLRITDKGIRVRDYDSSYVDAVDGKDILLTIDIDTQAAADAALRKQICGEADLDAACLVLMEVKTGAIRAMVNLKKDIRSGSFEEIENISIGRRHEPGSVFKTVTLLANVSDGNVSSLEMTLPTNKGIIQDARVNDVHIREHEAKYHSSRISIREGFKISSNYVFAKLAIDNYGDRKDSLLAKIQSYGLSDKFDFDLDGLQTPYVPRPRSNIELARLGYGYACEQTPLHILTFYNAIAGKGRMMKPYLIETGVPYILSPSICSKEAAEMVTEALKAVTEEGTAKTLKDAAVQVAGKTGTSFGTYLKGERGADPYTDKMGRKKYQGTFVGFFPAGDPQYSVICSIYSRPTKKSFQGGHIPALAIKELVDYLVKNDPYWIKEI